MEGNVDPVRDIEIIHEELRLKDEEMIDPIFDKLDKTAGRGGDKKLGPERVSSNARFAAFSCSCLWQQRFICDRLACRPGFVYNSLLLLTGHHE